MYGPMQFITDDDYNPYSVFALMMSMAENVSSCICMCRMCGTFGGH